MISQNRNKYTFHGERKKVGAGLIPATTVIMFRSIADIARSEGEDVQMIETKVACLEVFALGGSSEKDNAAESGYYAVKALRH